jgi:methionyl-tRNA formyltransferase
LALERILADLRFELAFIVPRFDSRDPVLKEQAEVLAVDFLILANVNSPESLRALASYQADIFVSMSYNQILKKELLAIPRLGVINCHAGCLPFYRGRNVLNWALINGASEFGVTVHFVDEGIDTGDIILQRKEAITDDDTYRTLLDRAIGACATALYEALCQIADGTVTRRRQEEIHPVGTYFGRRVEGDEWIDWNWASRRIFDFVRGISLPGPCARTMLLGMELVVDCAELIPGAPVYIATPGEIVQVRSSGGVVVKTGDSTIAIFARVSGTPLRLRIGHRLQSKLDVTIENLARRVRQLEHERAELNLPTGPRESPQA